MMFNRGVHDRISGAGGQVEQRSSMLHDAHANALQSLQLMDSLPATCFMWKVH